MSLSFPILTYHSQIFHSNHYFGNDHVALARDLDEKTEKIDKLLGQNATGSDPNETVVGLDVRDVD